LAKGIKHLFKTCIICQKRISNIVILFACNRKNFDSMDKIAQNYFRRVNWLFFNLVLLFTMKRVTKTNIEK
jgi:hypothetical protein